MRLSEYPYVVLRIECSKCGRRGQYRLARLAAKHGAEIELPWLLHELASGCSRRQQGIASVYDRCGAFFPDLSGSKPPHVPAATRPKLKVVTYATSQLPRDGCSERVGAVFLSEAAFTKVPGRMR